MTILHKINCLRRLVGNTPVVNVNNYLQQHKTFSIYAKLEMYNLSGSIKDRIVIDILRNIVDSGEAHKLIVEATSGNTGISLSLMSSNIGLSCRIYIPSNKSHMRIAMMKYYGADVILTDSNIPNQHIYLAEEYCRDNRESSIYFDQNGNVLNPLCHYNNLAQEIIYNIDYKIDYFVSGFGTGGTLTGVARKLKEVNPNCKIIHVEPSEINSCIEGLMKYDINLYVPSIYERSLIDQIHTVSDNDAINATHYLNMKEGILAGISSGAAYHVACQISKEVKNCTIVCIFPDHIDRYITTPWFQDKTNVYY